jgi:GDP-L-fucose synthase
MQEKNTSETGEFINIGTGCDLSIKELADLIQQIIYADKSGENCNIKWDSSKPNGTSRKLLDVSKLTSMGWRARTNIKEGIAKAYTDFLRNQ